MKTKFIFALLLFSLTANAGAIEVFLEENRSETGTIGYVDIDRVFKDYSGTVSSRDDLDKEISKKEEIIDKKNENIFHIKAKIIKLRQEKELAITIPDLLENTRRMEEAAKKLEEEKKQLQKQAKENALLMENLQNQKQEEIVADSGNTANTLEQNTNIVSSSGTAVLSSSDTVTEVKTSTITGTQNYDIIDSIPLPELPQINKSTDTVSISSDTISVSSDTISISSDTIKGNDISIKIPGIGSFTFTVSTTPAVIQENIDKLETELKNADKDLKEFRAQAEKDLLKYEESKTKHILGKIYTALKELSEQEEISVVVDKRDILYGKNTVDLTQRLIELLENGEGAEE